MGLSNDGEARLQQAEQAEFGQGSGGCWVAAEGEAQLRELVRAQEVVVAAAGHHAEAPQKFDRLEPVSNLTWLVLYSRCWTLQEQCDWTKRDPVMGRQQFMNSKHTK